MSELIHLEAGMAIVYGGNRVSYVSEELASAFEPGDQLLVVQRTGDLLHVPAAEHKTASDAVSAAWNAFSRMGQVTDAQINDFYGHFADRLADDTVFAEIAEANVADVEMARAKGRSTTRLELSQGMRQGMIDGLRGWAAMPSRRGAILETVDHGSWRVDQVVAGLGVVGFVFEGRPNVFADATGVLRGGNTVVFRIGSDALGTARAIVRHALDPALESSGLPPGAASLVGTPSRAAGYAMFTDPRLALAVARGSGAAVAQLGSVAQQAGIPVSLHGTGGAWIVAAETADASDLAKVVTNSLDRKVCNTLNTVCIVESRAAELVPVVLDALAKAGELLGTNGKLHVARGSERYVPAEWFDRVVPIARAEGNVDEPQAELIGADQLGREWEWEQSPEMTLKIVADIDEAARLFNEQSPRFAASLVSNTADDHDRFFELVDAPFVGNGFTRWVDGQYALDRPELGLSNWQHGRLFGRAGVLSGDSVFTIRSRVTQADFDLRR